LARKAVQNLPRTSRMDVDVGGAQLVIGLPSFST
jgi:hypothetical protein